MKKLLAFSICVILIVIVVSVHGANQGETAVFSRFYLYRHFRYYRIAKPHGAGHFCRQAGISTGNAYDSADLQDSNPQPSAA